MPPRLAREAVTAAALRGDTAALLSASAYLPAREAFRYDRRRTAAFASALAGDRELALAELGLGGGVRSLRLGIDAAVVELLTRGASPAVNALALALTDGIHSEPDVPLVLAECVRREPETMRAALAVALGGGTPLERTRAAAAVLGAAPFGRVETAVPALAAVSLALAVVAFLRLPGLIGGEETAAPRLSEPRPTVVVTRPPALQPATAPRSEPETDVIQIAVRPRLTGAGLRDQDSAGAALPTHARTAPRPTPTAPVPAAPATPAAPAVAPSAPAAASAANAPAAAPQPPPESARELTKSRASKAERKAAKAEQKAVSAERRAERKAQKNAAVGAAATVAAPPVGPARADEENEAGPAAVDELERPGRHAKSDKREKSDESDREN